MILTNLPFLNVQPRQLTLTADLTDLLAAPELRSAHIGVLVTDDNGNELFNQNADQRFTPASNEKVFTCAWALSVLGENYVPSLNIWKGKNGISLQTSGYPMLSVAELIRARHQLKLSGKGTVFVNQAYRPYYPDAWEIGDLPNRYAAPVTALTVDRGSLELWWKNNRFQLLPSPFGVTVHYTPSNEPLSDQFNLSKATVTVSGKPPVADRRIDTLAIPYPDVAAATYFGNEVRWVQTTPNRPPDLTLGTDPLPKSMGLCLHVSDNNLAENFLCMAEVKLHGPQLNPYPRAIADISSFLHQTVGIPAEICQPDDGSGLSRHNVQSPRSLVDLFQWSLRQPTKDLWMSMLDQNGSGTIMNRLPGTLFHGKTGSMDMVSSLSGILTVNGKNYFLSIIQNQFAYKMSAAKALENKIVEKIAADLRTGTVHAP